MFRSSENLRLAADMRALERVAAPWRQARRTWFDGTPESIEARLASTERVLTFAKAGVTEAHIALEREATVARAELKEASHRLMVDFLDDGARAFKGSRRVAERGLRECINCGGALSGEEDDDKDSECGTCGKSAHKEGYRVARAPEENENWEEGANYAEYNGKCTRCKSDNIDSAGRGHGSGEYDCYDCGATFHPKVRKLKSGLDTFNDTGSAASLRHRDDRENNRYTVQHIPGAPAGGPQRAIVNHDSTELMSADGAHHWAGLHTAGEEYDGLDALSRDLGQKLLDPQGYARSYRDEDGPGLPGGLPMNLRKHLNHPDPEQGAYNAGYEASGGNGEHSPYMDHEDPWDAAGNDWYRSGGGHGDAFNDGWGDYASEIPHRYNTGQHEGP